MSKEVVLKFPVELPEEGLQDQEALEKAKETMILELLRKGEITQGKAAELLGISLWDLPLFLTQYQIPWFNYSQDDLKKDLDTFGQKLKSK
ncbi:MAG: UPF0175 family protein [Candidatus Tectomicrobia bacterium]|uniref:UPF0175 family protein n=1 Tax=Tectimicrobiota bacterium TaxID=2528274 RepID=A0A933LQB3_UNCTE|nr:UPF0175 family protein [Candidatus Tectomicrobia bacterium]